MIPVKNFGYRIPVGEALGWKLNGTTLGNTLGALTYDEATAQEVIAHGKPVTSAFFKPEIKVAVCALDGLDYFEVRLIPYTPEVEQPLPPEEQEKITADQVVEAEEEAKMLLGMDVVDEEEEEEARLQEAEMNWNLIESGAWVL